MKYEVKNCPAKNTKIEKRLPQLCASLDGKAIYCRDCPDCLIKRVIEKCKSIQWTGRELFNDAQVLFAEQILNMFKVEEND